MASMLQRIAAAAACALLLAGPASAQTIGSGHVLGNPTGSPATATDTSLTGVMSQTGSGVAAGVGTVLGVAPNTSGGMATLGAAPVNGQCGQFNSAGKIVPAGGACTVGGGGGTVNAGSIGQVAGYNAATNAVVGVPLQCTPIELWGGGTSASGATNNTAYTNAAAAFGSTGGCLSFSSGTYNFASSPTITYPNGQYSVALVGAGPDVTILKFPSSNGPFFVMGTNCQAGNPVCNPSFHVRDMSITTTQAPSSNAICLNATFIAPQLTFPPWSDITNVTCRADTSGSRTTGWNVGFNLRGVSFVNITNALAIGMPTPSSGTVTGGTGIGLNIQGSVVQAVNPGSFNVNTAYTITSLGGSPNFTAVGASSNTVGVTFIATGAGSGTGTAATVPAYGVAFNVSNSSFVFNQLGIQWGDWQQGTTITNTNINFNTIGMQTFANEQGANCCILVENSYINNYSNNFQTLGHIGSIQFSNDNFIIFANSSGIVCQPCDGGSFIGNTFNGASLTNTLGLVLEGSNNGPVTVVGNVFGGLLIGADIVSPATNINLQSNSYLSNTVNVSNTGTIKAGSCTGISGGTCTAGATP